ncbi:unnamed protein product [Vicia faba]|uniref:Mediator complex subunit 15 KIX domain-containing protein n=1 Tax=Vicia faba TaxID=3906 RepID=A0AAV1AQX4_VICFA|nr:unnamed protein product [Vicia faba]
MLVHCVNFSLTFKILLFGIHKWSSHLCVHILHTPYGISSQPFTTARFSLSLSLMVVVYIFVFHPVTGLGFRRHDCNCISSMDTNNGVPNQGDWRGQLHPGSRQRIVNKIMEAIKKHLPVCGQEGLLAIHNIAQMFEDKVFTIATSQYDYIKKISMKMLAFETQFQSTTVTNITSLLDMLTLEADPQDTMANTITSSVDRETESQGNMANKETESQGNMANNITSSLDMQTESQGTVANNMTSNQVAPINELLDPEWIFTYSTNKADYEALKSNYQGSEKNFIALELAQLMK